VTNLLRQRGVPVVDADTLARQVVEPGTRALRAIVAEFGPEILLENGNLNREKLGGIIFNDEAKRRRLNAIVHPAVRRAMIWAVVRLWMCGERVCVLDVPLLVEAGIWRWMGKVVVVYCSDMIQLQRLEKRDKCTHEAAAARVRAQMAIADKLEYADQVIDNSGGPSELEPQVDALIRRLERETGWTWRLDIFPLFGIISALVCLFRRRLKASRRGQRRRRGAR